MKQTISTLKRSLAVLAVFLAATGLAQAEYLYVANVGDNTIEKFSSSGADLGVFASTFLNCPQALAFDSHGNLYVANFDNTIKKFSSSGADLGVFTSANLNGPVALAFDNSGNFYVANYSGTHTIEKFSSTGTDLGVFASTGLSQPSGIAFGTGGPV